MSDLIERIPEGFMPGPWWISGKRTIRQGEHLWIAKAFWQATERDVRLIALAPELAAGYRAQAARIAELEAEVARLRDFIADLHNRARHDWAADVDAATDRLFCFSDYGDGFPPLQDEWSDSGEHDRLCDEYRGLFPHAVCRMEWWKQIADMRRQDMLRALTGGDYCTGSIARAAFAAPDTGGLADLEAALSAAPRSEIPAGGDKR